MIKKSRKVCVDCYWDLKRTKAREWYHKHKSTKPYGRKKIKIIDVTSA